MSPENGYLVRRSVRSAARSGVSSRCASPAGGSASDRVASAPVTLDRGELAALLLDAVARARVCKAAALPARRPKPVRYEPPNPDELVPIDIKTLGRVPSGDGPA